MNMNVDVTEETATAPVVCDRLCHGYEDQRVLDGLTFRIPRGEVLGLIGKNGAGKSTLIRILVGLQQPHSGSSQLFGEPSLALSDASKARLGYVPQQPEAFAWMRVSDMLDFVGRLYPRWDRAFVERALARWELPRSRQLAKLSPGERQRVALIRALAASPELLVLDEPAAALDPVARRALLREIAVRAGESGTTVLFSTHIVSDLERVASQVAFLHDTRLVLNAPLDELPERYARLVVPAPRAAQFSAGIPGELSRRQRADGSLAIVIARAAAAPQSLPEDARLDLLSLEDLFIEVAG
jgi:ABC-2 type transport system ATP-binding protein